MRTLLLSILVLLSGCARPASEKLLDFEISAVPLREALAQLEKRSGETIILRANVDMPITLAVRKKTLSQILALIAEQANCVAVDIYPIYSTDSSLAALTGWFRGAGEAPLKWSEVQRQFSGKERVVYFRDPSEDQPGVTLSITNAPAQTAASFLSRAAGVHVALEDGVPGQVSLSMANESVETAVDGLSKKLGKRWASFHALLARPESLMRLSAKSEIVEENSGGGERRVMHRVQNREPGPEDQARMEKLQKLSPEEQKAFLADEFRGKAVARMQNGIRNETSEQRVMRRREGGRQRQEVEVR